MFNKSISAVTVTYFSEISDIRALLESFINAVYELRLRNEGEVVYYIVDNSEDAAYFSELKTVCDPLLGHEYVDIKLIRSGDNLGYGGGNNKVLNMLGSDYHLIINPDVTLDTSSLWLAVEHLEEKPGVGLLTPKVLGGSYGHHVVKNYPDCFTLLLRYIGGGRLSRMFKYRLDKYQCTSLSDIEPQRVDIAGGCFFFVRTALFQQLKGFDRRFFMYFEDYDLSIRLNEISTMVYDPAIKITHTGGDVGRKSIRHHIFFAISSIKFFNKHGWRLW